MMLTNGGGILESKRAQVVNNIAFGKPSGESLLQGDHMILCHTPLKNLAAKY
jgi:hypothetical protein